ncbi:MAG: hypothetical protein AAB436_01440 [Patescibacteria group bacterium]
MAVAAAERTKAIPNFEQAEQPALPVDERCLTEVDNFNYYRQEDGSHSYWAQDEVLTNLITATKEAAMPYAVSKTEHVYEASRDRDEKGRLIGSFVWLGKTAVENAQSGLRYHKHPAALERVKVEVDEAQDAQQNLRPGTTKVFISPRMSRSDATLEVAQAEHLADDDSVRISDAVADDGGKILRREMQSLLVRDIPLEAWVAMLEDPNNIFGKSIQVDNPDSALSVMKTHRELEIPSDKLPKGVISIIEAVAPYVEDRAARSSLEAQLERFHESQEEIDDKAVNIAKRWRDFEMELADSLHDGEATLEVRSFINSMQDKWNDDDLAVINEHAQPSANYKMSRQLAAIIEKAKQNMLWVRAGVITGNEKVLEQLDEATADKIYETEMSTQEIYQEHGNTEQMHIQNAQMDRQIANQNVDVGGGCPGESKANFKSDILEGTNLELTSSKEKRVGRTRRRRCVVEGCPTSPREVKVGGCGVCLERCQKLFDKGRDPTKMSAASKASGKSATANVININQPEKPKDDLPTKEQKPELAMAA